MIVYLVHLGLIGAECSAGAGETERDHEGFECPREVQDYMSWERGMRNTDSVWVDRTYYQLRRLAADYWRARTGTARVRTDAWTRYHQALRQTVIRMDER